MATYWLVGGPNDGEGRVQEDRGPTEETVTFREDSWKYGRGYYRAVQPVRYIDTVRGQALILEYVGETAPR